MTQKETASGDGTATRSGTRWDGIVAVLLGLAVNEVTLEWLLVPDGELSSWTIRITVAGVQLALIATGLFVLIRRPARRIPWARLGLAAGSTVFVWFLCFAGLDLFAPGLIDLPGVRYFEYRRRFQPDSSLVMVPRRTGDTLVSRLRGDLAAADDGLSPLDIEYRAAYNERGFRRNGGLPPWDAVVIGDSFVAFGERDSTTVSEMLRRASGLSTYNLGRGWYGPHQYVELLRRHGPKLDPQFAVVCFFEGNDPADVVAYRQWKSGDSYDEFSLIEGNLPQRFVKLNLALLAEFQHGVEDFLAGGDDAASRGRTQSGRRTLAIELSGERSKMRFAYWPASEQEPGQLLRTNRWETIRELFAEFRRLTEQSGIQPVLVFIPSKISVYGPFLVAGADLPVVVSPTRSGQALPNSRAEALRRIASELDLPFLDLTPLFRRRAAEPPILYYRQDTHWTTEGRRLAADTIAAFLSERWPEEVGEHR